MINVYLDLGGLLVGAPRTEIPYHVGGARVYRGTRFSRRAIYLSNKPLQEKGTYKATNKDLWNMVRRSVVRSISDL
jgi:hypothetical protein